MSNCIVRDSGTVVLGTAAIRSNVYASWLKWKKKKLFCNNVGVSGKEVGGTFVALMPKSL